MRWRASIRLGRGHRHYRAKRRRHRRCSSEWPKSLYVALGTTVSGGYQSGGDLHPHRGFGRHGEAAAGVHNGVLVSCLTVFIEGSALVIFWPKEGVGWHQGARAILPELKVRLGQPHFDLAMVVAGGENSWLDLVLEGGRWTGLYVGESSRRATQGWVHLWLVLSKCRNKMIMQGNNKKVNM
jgi:hypothetical protein